MDGDDPITDLPERSRVRIQQTCSDLGYRCNYIVRADQDCCSDCGDTRAVESHLELHSLDL